MSWVGLLFCKRAALNNLIGYICYSPEEAGCVPMLITSGLDNSGLGG